MSERPIPLDGPEVRGVLAGTKTQFRRVVKLVGADVIEERVVGSGEATSEEPWPFSATWSHGDDGSPWYACPFGAPGDRLWVRETWAAHWMYDDVPPTEARSGREDLRDTDNLWFSAGALEDAIGTTTSGRERCPASLRGKWRPSIHMPRWASRITLEVTGVRVERLQAISATDAISEGIERDGRLWKGYRPERGPAWRQHMSPVRSFESLWESINGEDSWALNPWVWVVEFKRVTP